MPNFALSAFANGVIKRRIEIYSHVKPLESLLKIAGNT